MNEKKPLTLTLTRDEMECVVRWAMGSVNQPDTPAAAWIINEAAKKQCVSWLDDSVREKPQAKANEVAPVVTAEPIDKPPGPTYPSVESLELVFKSVKPMTIHTFANIWNHGDGPRDFLTAIHVPITRRTLQAASMTAYRLRREGRDIRRGKRGAKHKGGVR
jgi:hypothetical protein